MAFRAARQLRPPVLAAAWGALSASPARLPARLPFIQTTSRIFSSWPNALMSRQSRTAPDPIEPSVVSNASDLSKPVQLPPLTKGIPSILGLVRLGKKDRKDRQSTHKSSREKRLDMYENAFLASLAGLAIVFVVHVGRDWDEEEAAKHPDVPAGQGLGEWWHRARIRTQEIIDYFRDPDFDKLLPDRDPDSDEARLYTLVIGVEDLLVHEEWTREHGWRIAKRPGADFFIHYLSQYYEIVLFSTAYSIYGDNLMRKLDPYKIAAYSLYKGATKYKDGQALKDLSYLNRDLAKVIIIDNDPAYVRAQPENAILLPKWLGDPKDTELVSYIPFLEYLWVVEPEDVRQVLRACDGTNIPLQFARWEAQVRLEIEQKANETKSQGIIASLQGLMLNFLSSFKSSFKSSTVDKAVSVKEASYGEMIVQGLAQGRMMQDIVREIGLLNYKDLQEVIRLRGEQWLKELKDEEEKAAQEVVDGVKQTMSGWLRKSPSPPPQNQGTLDAPSQQHPGPESKQ